MRTIENDIPEILLELAREAFSLGLGEVYVGFWYMGDSFISPIEWNLSLGKRDSNLPGEYIRITMDRGDEQPAAYIPNPNGNPLEGSYWGPEEIRAWMREPLESAGEYIPSWEPVTDPEAREKFLLQWPLFESGVRSGWIMERNVDWEGLELRRQSAAEIDRELPAGMLPNMKISWEISNSFYNKKGHPDHRSTGTPVSVRGSGMIGYGQEKFHEPAISESGRVTLNPLSKEEVEDILSTNHRWFVRVAYNDEDRERWLHFPEALKSPAKTLDPSKFQRGGTP